MVSRSLKLAVDMFSFRAIMPSKISASIPIYIRSKTARPEYAGFKRTIVTIASEKIRRLNKSKTGIFRVNFCIHSNLQFAFTLVNSLIIFTIKFFEQLQPAYVM